MEQYRTHHLRAEGAAAEATAGRRRPGRPPDRGLEALRRGRRGRLIDLEIARGEFFTMLGPSGSGKTTTLRMIAGFEVPDAGRVELAGADVTGLPPTTARSTPSSRTTRCSRT